MSIEVESYPIVTGDRRFSWIDGLPPEWDLKPLKYACRINGDTLDEDTRSDFSFRYIDIGSVNSDGCVTVDAPITFADAPSRARRVLHAGDVFLSTVRTYLTAIAYCDETLNSAVCSTGFAVLTPSPEIDPRFLYYWTRSSYFVGEVTARSTGVSYPAINAAEIGNFPIPVISRSRQRAIAAFLDRKTAEIDALIAKKQRQIELLEEKRRSLLNHIVTKGLDRTVALKDSGIEWFGFIPQHWTIKRLGWITSVINDINHEMPTSVESGVPFLSAKDLLDDGSLNFVDNIKMISKEDFVRLSAKVLPRRHDIIYSRIGACLGKARMVETDTRFLISYSCCVIRLDTRVADPHFYCQLLDSDLLLTEAKARTQGIGVPDLGLQEIARFPVPCPPLEEQRQIADYLVQEVRRIRKMESVALQQVGLLREYRQSLISAAVTGKVDVFGEDQ